MDARLHLLLRIALGLWAAAAALAPPGLPACWLQARPCAVHVHYGESHAGSAHAHDYLLELAHGQPVQISPLEWTPIGLLLALLFPAQILRPRVRPALTRSDWLSSPDPPPPRLSLSS